MEQKPPIDQKIIALYDEYTHAPLPRRVFIKRLTALAGSTVAASALLPLLENNYAQAAVVAPDAPDLLTRLIRFPAGRIQAGAYLARPKADGKYPAVLVIHENRGLNPHIEDIARRLAKAGFLALAVDYLSGQGGTPDDEDKARDLIEKTTAGDVDAISLAAVAWLKTHDWSTGKIGSIGFCWGGGAVNRLAEQAPDLSASIAFYGMQPDLARVPAIRAALQLHYAGLDTRIDEGIPAFEAALKAAGKAYEVYVYEGVNHAFNNDTNAARYDARAATLAWQRSVSFLHTHLG